MPRSSTRKKVQTSTATTTSTTSIGSPDRMINNRKEGLSTPRARANIEDEYELLERGSEEESKNSKDEGPSPEESVPLSLRDKRAITLLVALYLLQGIPVGLAFGSIPFLLKSKLSYSQIGMFTLCTYPYSLKILWSPIVDSIYNARIGRRKSWIIPIQTTVGVMFWWLSRHISELLEVETPNVSELTVIFFTLVFFAATQDIAVDGWALTLLSKENLSYASTAQTVGLNTGYFLSFTVFLALNSLEFSNAYFRSEPLDYPLVSLRGYLQFSAIAYLGLTAYLTFFQKEDDERLNNDGDADMDLKKVYSVMWDIVQLKHVQRFLIVHLICKLGTATHEAATSLKLLEKGLKKEDLSLAVLIDFPFQILFGYLAAKWSKGERPLRPWILAMWSRLIWAFLSIPLIYFFTDNNVFFVLVVFMTVGSSFSSTVQFVGVSAFHAQVADPLIGGTYMTLLNTVSNLGGTWPRYFVLKGIDFFSKASCSLAEAKDSLGECVSDHGKALCSEVGGTCTVHRDGYYIMTSLCILTGIFVIYTFVEPTAKYLQTVPAASWRLKRSGGD